MTAIGTLVASSIDRRGADGDIEAAVHDAFRAIAATGERDAPDDDPRERFEAFIRANHWLIEPAGMPGFDLDSTRFAAVPTEQNPAPDLAELLSAVFWQLESPDSAGFGIVEGPGLAIEGSVVGDRRIQLPVTLLYGLLFAIVAAPGNVDEVAPDGYYLSLGSSETFDFMQFPINAWWGDEATLRGVAAKHNQGRGQRFG